MKVHRNTFEPGKSGNGAHSLRLAAVLIGLLALVLLGTLPSRDKPDRFDAIRSWDDPGIVAASPRVRIADAEEATSKRAVSAERSVVARGSNSVQPDVTRLTLQAQAPDGLSLIHISEPTRPY